MSEKEFSTFMDGEDCPDCTHYEKQIKQLQAELERVTCERHIIDKILDMGAESLNPDMFVSLEEICKTLELRRKDLRETNQER